ncbi:amidohydrolase family protein [Bergeriella denitrificans]|uniref:Predicted metal-dependent hydrolase of the TIM-barrel fold n=1 Tax=Bergeriella denitrificans TaxID=494 RepID=A0A378UIG8_BERDE|nr:amidohydrolase family protein [Bergeriella denitrificans]STZ77158.1 Predicted metal-dependent hydrolase of the TIM-barrel fold [Bergeriella denitrificans]
MNYVDTHAHVFEADGNFIENARYTPDYNASVTDFLGRLDACGLHYGVLIQPSFYGTDNSVMLQAVAQSQGRLKAVAVVDTDVSEALLAQYRSQGVCGIRLNLFGKPVPDVGTPEWKRLLGLLHQFGWHLELHCPPDYLLQLLPALANEPVDIVIDHLGRPEAQQDLSGQTFRQFITLLNPEKHWVKLSGLYRLAAPQNQVSRGKEIYRMLQAQGMQARIVWGSDWPHTQHESETGYGQNWQLLHEIVEDEQERQQILGANARKLFGFDTAAPHETRR